MASDNDKPRIGEEIRKMEAEPLLPIEKKLIAWSLTSAWCCWPC